MATASKRIEIIKKVASDGYFKTFSEEESSTFVRALCKYIEDDIPNANGKYEKTTTHVERYTSTTGDLGIKGMSKNTEVKTRETKTTETVDDSRVFDRISFERAVGNVLASLTAFQASLPRAQADSLLADFDESVSFVMGERKDLFPADPVAAMFEFLRGLEPKTDDTGKSATGKMSMSNLMSSGPVSPLLALKTSSSLKRIWALLQPFAEAQKEKELKADEETEEEKQARLERMKSDQERWKREKEEEKARKAKIREEQKQREEANKAAKAAKKAEEDAERRAQEAAEAEEIRLWREREAQEEAEKELKAKQAAEAAEKERLQKEQEEKQRMEEEKIKRENPFSSCPAELQSFDKGFDVARALAPALQFARDWDAFSTIYNHTNWTTAQLDFGIQSLAISSVRNGGSLWTSSTPISIEVWMSSDQLATAKKAPCTLAGMTGTDHHDFAVPSDLSSTTTMKNLRTEQVTLKVLAKGKKLLCEFAIPLNTLHCLAAVKRICGSDGKQASILTVSVNSTATETTAKKAGELKIKEKTGRPSATATLKLSVKAGAIDVAAFKKALSP